MNWMNLIAVAGGGALGATARYGVNQLFVAAGRPYQPWRTNSWLTP